MSLRPHHLFPASMTQMRLLVLDLLPRADNGCSVHYAYITYAPHQHRSGELTICYPTLFLAPSFITSKQEMGVKQKVCILDVYEKLNCILLAQCKIFVLVVWWQVLNSSAICSVALSIISKQNIVQVFVVPQKIEWKTAVILSSTKTKEPKSANITSLNKTANLSGIQGY